MSYFSKRVFRRKRWIALVLVAVGVVASVACAQSRTLRAYLFGRQGMAVDANDTRIYIEEGIPESRIELVRTILDECVTTIEAIHGRSFQRPIRVYLCATQQSYNDRTGAPKQGRARGAVFADCLFISPRTFETQTCRGILTHELSHLHFRQILGTAYTTGLPGWFQEGLAVYASGGGGAEPVSEYQARSAIIEGEALQPEAVGANLPRMSASHGLPHHMFYRQAGMFVKHLDESRPAAFDRFLTQLFAGVSFQDAFESSFEVPVTVAWNDYCERLNHAEQ